MAPLGEKKRAKEKARRPRSAARDRVAKNHSLIFSPLHWHLGHTWKNDLRFVVFFFSVQLYQLGQNANKEGEFSLWGTVSTFEEV